MLLEGPHDVRIVVVKGKAKITHSVVEQPAVAEVATEYIAGKQHLLFLQIGALGIRPVQKGRVQKPQRAIAETDAVTGAHRGIREGLVARLQRTLEHAGGALRNIQARLRCTFHQLRQCPARRRVSENCCHA